MRIKKKMTQQQNHNQINQTKNIGTIKVTIEEKFSKQLIWR